MVHRGVPRLPEGQVRLLLNRHRVAGNNFVRRCTNPKSSVTSDSPARSVRDVALNADEFTPRPDRFGVSRASPSGRRSQPCTSLGEGSRRDTSRPFTPDEIADRHEPFGYHSGADRRVHEQSIRGGVRVDDRVAGRRPTDGEQRGDSRRRVGVRVVGARQPAEDFIVNMYPDGSVNSTYVQLNRHSSAVNAPRPDMSSRASDSLTRLRIFITASVGADAAARHSRRPSSTSSSIPHSFRN